MFENKTRFIDHILFYAGILAILFGICLGAYFGTSSEYFSLGKLQGIIGIVFFLGGLFFGILLIGLSELSKQLNKSPSQASDRDYKDSIMDKISQLATNSVIDEQVKTEIASILQEGHQLQNIKQIVEDIYLVQTNQTLELIELGGFSPKVLNVADVMKHPELKLLL